MRINPISAIQTHKISANKSVKLAYTNKTTGDSFERKNSPYLNPLTFEAITAKGVVAQRGMLMHITSLPAHRSYCGQFCDPQTYKFIDFLKAAKQNIWIVNPLNALEQDLCPYNASGRFSRNKFIVNLNELVKPKYGCLLKEKELPEDISTPDFTLEMLEKQKNPRFKLAYKRFLKLDENAPIKQEFNKFEKENNELWLNAYANYDALSKKFGTNWHNWSKRLQTAPEVAREDGVDLTKKILEILGKKQSVKNYQNQIGLYKFEQFLYDKQFNETVEYLDKNEIRLMMDLPIGIHPSGADVWSKKNIFLLDKNFKPTKVSGCPPEGAYSYTQVWGHALYNYDSPEFWEYQEASLRQLLKADLRLDHFVGYINRAEIPTKYEKADGTVLKGGEIFKPIKDGGMGVEFFQKDWIKDISKKRSPQGENIYELFIRVARELGRKPEETYILESFGPLAKTRAYKNFEKNYGNYFISQRVPIGMGIGETNNATRKLNATIKNEIQPIAYLTGNHDMQSLREFIDSFIDAKPKSTSKKSKKLFQDFCKNELKLSDEEMKNSNIVFENTMKWHYTQNVKQVQTTIQDALGIYWRPNIPGSWNGMEDKYLMKPTPEALLPFWSRVFPKDFLDRENPSGINSGYKSLAEKFVKMMQELFPEG